MPTPAEREGRDREARTVCLRGTAIMGAVMSSRRIGGGGRTYHDRYRPVFLHSTRNGLLQAGVGHF